MERKNNQGKRKRSAKIEKTETKTWRIYIKDIEIMNKYNLSPKEVIRKGLTRYYEQEKEDYRQRLREQHIQQLTDMYTDPSSDDNIIK